MLTIRFLAFALLLLVVACASNGRNDLYQALGGESGVRRLVDEVVRELHSDARISKLFKDTDDSYFKERLFEQFCELSGGGCTYAGLSMEEAHSGMQLTETDFNFFIEDTRVGMTRAGISIGAQNRLLALLRPMHGDTLHQ
ncbi:MAG: group 1 truncated hemoglobin [Pseudomonadota bacterium]|nr:group 1 truncated hemoglobin [Pseudomonadota bacterium]